MTSKIKVDNINKVSDDSNIINKCGTTITLGASGDTINLASGASQTGFGRTGTVDWITTPKVTGDSPVTAVTGKGYFLNTTAGTIALNLPAGSSGDIVSMADYAATWQTYAVTVSPNGTQKIGGTNRDVTLSTEGQSVTFVYVDAVQGWVNTMDSTSNVRANEYIRATGGSPASGELVGNYRVHTFTSPGTFTVCATALCAAYNVVDYMVVAGGGGAGSGFSSGGGGAGGGGSRYFLNTTCAPTGGAPGAPLNGYGSPTPSGTAITVTATPYPISVGAGGTGAPITTPGRTTGGQGCSSTFSTVVSAGGGGGGSESLCAPIYTGAAGGSGGGGAYHPSTTGSGAGNTPPTTPPQGTAGGNFGGPSPGDRMGGGGGGSLCAGQPGLPGVPTSLRGNGGDGLGVPNAFGTSGEICGSYYYFGGGGGAQCQYQPRGAGDVAKGGLGGGGNGSSNDTPSPNISEAGADNTGGGGGGQTPTAPTGITGGGGSGIVIIRYKAQ